MVFNLYKVCGSVGKFVKYSHKGNIYKGRKHTISRHLGARPNEIKNEKIRNKVR